MESCQPIKRLKKKKKKKKKNIREKITAIPYSNKNTQLDATISRKIYCIVA
jgi:hypothetical protein